MSSHTPGPWAARRRDHVGDNIFASDSGKRIANTYGPTEDAEFAANARLIAAAPEMLDFLHGVATNQHGLVDHVVARQAASLVSKIVR